jgi:hypothetical protein
LAKLDSIAYTRGIFAITQLYADLRKAFFACNTISLVAFPVGQHTDQFNENGEAIENKLLICLPNRETNGNTGRGGSLIKNQFVVACLDWSLATRRFYVDNAVAMGIGPVQPRNSQPL